MTSEQALRWCSDSGVWSEFGARVLEAAEKVDSSFLSLMGVHQVEESNQNIDWR